MPKSKRVDHKPRLEETSLVGDLIASGACFNIVIHADGIMSAQRGLMMVVLEFPAFTSRLPIAVILNPDHLPAPGGMGVDWPPRPNGQISFSESAYHLSVAQARHTPGLMLFDPFAGQAYQALLSDAMPLGTFQFILPTIARLS